MRSVGGGLVVLGALGCAPEPIDSAAPLAVCPPEGPSGVDPGDTVLDLVFETCTGSETSLHAACGAPSLVLGIHGWCPPCLEHLDLAASLTEEYPELQVLVVVAEDPLAQPADAAYCLDLRDFSGLSASWLLDPEDQLAAFGGPGLTLVLSREGVIALSRDDATEAAIRAAVAEAAG